MGNTCFFRRSITALRTTPNRRAAAGFFLGLACLWSGCTSPLLNSHEASAEAGIAAPEFTHVTVEPVSTKAFTRISEFFSGSENQGGKLILRTDPEVRKGLYVIGSLSTHAMRLPPETVVRLEFITPQSPRPQEVTFTLQNANRNSRELWLGLTGEADLPEGDTLVAWALSLESPGGDILTRKTSFMWELPPAGESE